MIFQWTEYKDADAALVDSWLDDYAVNETGLDEGWQTFYDYWTKENVDSAVENFCYIISKNNKPFSVIFLAVIEKQELLISEFIVSPTERGKGYGSAVLKELLLNCREMINANISVAKTVIYPSNIPSKKAFEKAGFKLYSVHPDGDATEYEFHFAGEYND